MIRTVLGDIDKTQTKSVLMHEHIQCVSNDMLFTFGNRWLDEKRVEEYAISILRKLKAQLGIDVFVDGTAVDLGRNVRLLKNISQATGVHIVASTGLYYYPSMVTCMRSAEELSEWFLYECENGMEGTDILPGILKCAADGAMTDDIKKRIKAMSIVQAKTGLPMYAHCSHTNDIAHKMIEIFENNGVDPEKTILGHASRRLDTEYLSELLRLGYYICIDQSWEGEEAKVAEVVFELCERGFEKQLLFSHDRPLYNDFETTKKSGIDYPEAEHLDRFSFFTTKLIPEFIKLGCTNAQCRRFMHENPVRILDI